MAIRRLGLLLAAVLAALVAVAIITLPEPESSYSVFSVPCDTPTPNGKPTNTPGGVTKTPTPTGTPCQKPTDTPTVAPTQADLIVESISDAQSPFIDCTTPAGVKAVVRNIGTASAGASTTRVSVGAMVEFLATPALSSGESVTLLSTVQGIPLSDMYTAVADFGNVVAESNETNNSLTVELALATLPTCTPTTTPTPTLTPTPTKQPSPGDTDLDGCTDEQENGTEPAQGGLRDYLYFWDFFDVWTPTLNPLPLPQFVRDKAVTTLDIFAVAAQFGHDCS